MNESVLIVGCGVFGLSSAVEMAKRGYKVIATDAYPVPSPWSAAADYNKIIRTEYDNILYTELALEALEMWRNDPGLSQCYHECGRLTITPQNHQGRIQFDERSLENLKKLGKADHLKSYTNRELFYEDFPLFQASSLNRETKVTFNPESGLGYAAKSLSVIKNRAEKLGVQFLFGPEGEAVRVIEENNRTFVVTRSGLKMTADKILISSGAATPQIINLNNQASATGLFVGHIQLSESEYEKYKHIPIVFSAEEGYYFPPDPETRIIKIAATAEETVNVVTDQFGNKLSLPRYKTHFPLDTIPKITAKAIKNFLKKTLPEIAYHDILDPKICWISDTTNSNFLIDKAPRYKNVYVATGDSGHAYKFLPNIGRLISDCLEDKLDLSYAKLWEWNKTPKIKTLNWRVKKMQLDLAKNEGGYITENRFKL